MGILVSFRDVSKKYGDVCALGGLTLSMEEGEFFSILGPSGCGKTTLLRLLSGLESPDDGEIALEGKLVSSSRFVLEPEKRGIGMVFQSLALWPHMTVLENVEFPLHGKSKHKAREMLKRLGLEAISDRPPSQISGGEQQRVALARAIVGSPRILLLDEPFTGLDPRLRMELGSLVKDINKELGLTVLYVTHLREEAMSLADRMAVLKDGRIQQIGAPEEIYDHPENPFVAAFVGNANILEGEVTGPGVASTPVGAVTVSQDEKKKTILVAVSPESLRVDSGGPIRGVVRERNYRGGRSLYRIEVESQHLMVEISERLEVGGELRLELARKPLVFSSG
ncbi:MAG: ABC transporter ATP-binding protein [Elusimicrobiota bacterium]